jgi:hypothetical protein
MAATEAVEIPVCGEYFGMVESSSSVVYGSIKDKDVNRPL